MLNEWGLVIATFEKIAWLISQLRLGLTLIM